ncbi:MAG: hypothetical protein ACKO66_00035 [Flavobacteriales bacterium]
MNKAIFIILIFIITSSVRSPKNAAPIMHDYCEDCHSGANPSGGVLLTDFATIQDAALNGNLLNSLLGSNGVSIMPENSTGLPVCYIHQIEN